jgi:peroxiredoxin
VLPAGVGLPVGKRAPDLTVTDSTGKKIRMASLYEKGDVLLAFYRGGWDPFSNHQIQAYVEHHSELVRRGLTVVFVSADRSENVEATRKSFDVPFTMVGDPTLEVHRAFAVHTLVPPEIVQRMKERDMDIEAASGQTHHMLAVPSVFWIGQDGIIRLAHAEENHRIRPSPLQIASKVDGLKEETPPPSSE